jgi:hypothetical protein
MLGESPFVSLYAWTIDKVTRLKQNSSFLEFLTRDLAQFKFEDWSWPGYVNSVFVDYLKDWWLVIKLLEDIYVAPEIIFVPFPFFYLLPRQICLFFSLSSLLFRDFDRIFAKQLSEVFSLLFILSKTHFCDLIPLEADLLVSFVLILFWEFHDFSMIFL